MAGRMLPGELTWPKLLGTSIAAVVAAWLAGRLGMGNTLTGVAIGSIVATFGTAFFTTTIDKSHQAVLVRTDRGTIIEARRDDDIIVEDAGGTHVFPAQTDHPDPLGGDDTPSRWSRIHWKAVAIASLLTMAVTLGAISIYEGAVGRTWGSNEPGTTIGNTVRGGPGPTAPPSPTPTPTPSEQPSAQPSPSTEPSAPPSPTEAPTESPAPSPSPTTTDCPTPTDPADPSSPGTTGTDCPTPSASPSEDGGLLR